MPSKDPGSKNQMSSSTFKQATLSFASSKRTASTITSQKPKKTLQPKISPALHIVPNSDNIGSGNNIEEIHPQDSQIQKEGHTVLSKKISDVRKGSEDKASIAPQGILQSKDSQENAQTRRPELDENDPKWYQHYADVREKMGNLKPIHAEGQNKIHEILRVFDMSHEYGPCVGVTRLERWERASALGLNPPIEVREILSTRQGTEEPKISQSVLYDEV